MKVLISADIEGVCGTTVKDEIIRTGFGYGKAADQMSREVRAACLGVLAAGAKEIYVKDAHGDGLNIDAARLPEEAVLFRGHSWHPYGMVEGLDRSFDAAVFLGYHSACGKAGNPLSHTMTGAPQNMTINGEPASEFLIFSYAAALEGVPVVFVSGDRRLCEDALRLYPGITALPIKEGIGGMTKNMAPEKALRQIEQTVAAAVKQGNLPLRLPERFEVEIDFRNHCIAYRKSFYPGMVQISDTALRYVSADYFEVLRMFMFVLLSQ